MEKKSVAATILVLFLAVAFSVIGICFSVYVYRDTRILIEKVLVSAEGVSVYSDKELKKSVESLKLSDMELGLKPATGKLDSETQVPSTITDEGTSEGYYGCVYVQSGVNFKVSVVDFKIETEKNEIEAKEERKNIFISIKNIKKSTKSLENDITELAKFENVTEPQKLTFLIWLGSLAGEELVGAKISFTLKFEVV